MPAKRTARLPDPRRPHHPSPTSATAVSQALRGNESLASLLARVAESRRRFDTIVPLLPEGMRADVQPGPLDDTQWSLLAGNGAAAAKLRQLLPAIQAALGDAGLPAREAKVKVLVRR
jgi:hypothetical protein